MYILNLYLLSTIFLFLYIISYNLFLTFKKIPYILIIFLVYSFFLLISLTLLKDVYYFYLLFELLNICIYIILIYFSSNMINFKYLINYYFLSFLSSLLFIASLYNFTENNLAMLFINIAILIKLSIFPFSKIISLVYSNSSYINFLLLSFLINFMYVYVIYIYNQLNYVRITQSYYVIIAIIIINVPTLIYTYVNFLTQNNLKSFIALSSMTNIPIILFTCFTPYMQINFLSKDDYNLTVLYFFSYIIIYLINYLLLNNIIISIPNLNYQFKGIFYFNRISMVLNNMSTFYKHVFAILLLIIIGFPPTINFILKFQLFYTIFTSNNLLLVSLTLITLNTFIVYCYLRFLGRIVNSISIYV